MDRRIKSVATDVVGVGRKQLLDLREAVGIEPPKAKVKVEMNDVFRFGFTAEADVVQLTGEKKHGVSRSKTAAEPVRPKMTVGRRVWVIGQYPLLAAVALGAAYSTGIGQWFVVLYAVIAVWRKIDSRYSFGAAIFLLITVPLFQVLGQSGIAQNAAVYVFELLVIGTIQALWELRKTGEVPG